MKHCQKCWRRDDDPNGKFDKHHIIARSDGGINDPDNLTWLCYRCHMEWHHMIEACLTVPFDTWVTIPPYPVLATLYFQQTEEIKVAMWYAVYLRRHHPELVERNDVQEEMAKIREWGRQSHKTRPPGRMGLGGKHADESA